MMTLEEFRGTLPADAPPAGADLAVQALWWLAKGDSDRAHGCVQQREGEADCDWVHAHLHRVEGDPANAAYWYRRAGRPIATAPTDQEWADIAASLIA